MNVYSQLSLFPTGSFLQAVFAGPRHTVGGILQAVHQLEKGILHPTVVSQEVFLAVITQIARQLPEGLTFLLEPTLVNIRKFYEFSHVRLAPSGEVLRILITLPLRQEKNVFEL